MNTIQITNGKAFYEGVEIENQVDVYNLKIPVFRTSDMFDGLKDGTYPIPEGWEVVKEWICYRGCTSSNEMLCGIESCVQRQTAWLVRNEQPIQSKEELRKEFERFLNDEWPVREDCYPEIILRFFEPILQERDRQIEELKNKNKK